MDKKLFIVLNLAVAIAFGWFFLSTLDFAKVAEEVAKAKWPYLVAAAFLYLGMNVLNAARIRMAVDCEAGIARIFLKHMTSMLLSDFTPARAGYSTIVLKLRALGVKTGHAAKALGVLLATDFVVRALLAFYALALFAGLVDSRLVALAAVALALLSLALLYLLFREVRLLARLMKKIPFLGERLAMAYGETVSETPSKKFVAINLLASLAGAVLRGAAWTCVLLSLGLGGIWLLPELTVLCALVTALSFVPVSLAGMGLQEGAGALLLSSVLGLGLVEAGSVMVLVRFVEAGTDLLFGWPELLVNWRKA